MQLLVSNCVRCGKTHKIDFLRLDVAVSVDGDAYTHEGVCSEHGGPVLARIVEIVPDSDQEDVDE